MTAGVFYASENKKGNVVVEVSIDGRNLSVPKQGRAEDATLLAHNGKQVEVSINAAGTVTRIMSGNTLLLGQHAEQSQSQQQSLRQPSNPTRQPPSTMHAATQTSPAGDVRRKLQTISQQRAKHALDAVNACKDKDGEADVQRYIIGMPAMILMSGFGQTCAFYKSKTDHHRKILDALAEWLKKQGVYSSADIMQEIVHCDAKTYQLAQAESLEYLNWLKKFAKAYLKSDEKSDGQGGGQ